MDTLERDLIAEGLELRETHISRVFLGAQRVYKIKKPVQLGFLDFSTLELRREVCEREVALNRRLAPGIYCGVLAITRDAQGLHHLGGSGPAVEYAVEMLRLADRDAADRRLRDGRLEVADLQRIARRLAEFHATARCDAETARYGTLEAIAANVEENFEQTRADAPRYIAAKELAAIEQAQRDFLRNEAGRLAARVAQGRSRDGHGDLRLEHCYLDDVGHVDIIDCIEFNERFRYGDVCADLAFLAMDLRVNERADLSEALLAAYAREADDYDLYGLVDFYESYRAFVRAKVSLILANDATAEPEARERASASARKYFMLARAVTRESLERPIVVAVGGVIASGKSSVADLLSLRLQGPAIAADHTRKHLAGVAPHTPLSDQAFSGHYTGEQTTAVYAELFRRAEVVLRSGRPVILDASFRSRNHRLVAQELAKRCGVRFLFIECQASPEVCRARLRKRSEGPSVSDGRLDVFDAFVKSYEPISELPTDQYLQVDTGGPLDAALATIERAL